MERSVYLHMLQRWWWTLLLAAWVAGLVGYLAASQIPETYETRARLLVGPVNTDVTTVRAAESLSQTYAELATTESQLQRVIDRVGLNMEPMTLAGAVSVNANATTRILTVRAIYFEPELTAAIANAVAEELVALTSSALGRPEGELSLVDPAPVPLTPVGPNVSVITFLAGAAGLLIAGMLVAALEYFSHTVKSRRDLAELTGSTVLGEININHGYRGTPVQPLVVEAQPESKTALGYRLLASRMPLGEDGQRHVRSILVVGSQVGDRTGEFAANLAAILARTGRSVTLVDGDGLEAQVTNMFLPEGRIGLSDLLGLAPEAITDTDAIDNVRVRRMPDIEIIPAGTRESQSVRDDTAASLLEAIGADRDLVIVSGAPIHRSATSLVWARLVDGVVLVARADSTRVENVMYAVDSLRLVGADMLGAVLLERQRGGSRRRKVRRSATPMAVEQLQLRTKPIRPIAEPSVQSPASPGQARGPNKASERRVAGDKSAG